MRTKWVKSLYVLSRVSVTATFEIILIVMIAYDDDGFCLKNATTQGKVSFHPVGILIHNSVILGKKKFMLQCKVWLLQKSEKIPQYKLNKLWLNITLPVRPRKGYTLTRNRSCIWGLRWPRKAVQWGSSADLASLGLPSQSARVEQLERAEIHSLQVWRETSSVRTLARPCFPWEPRGESSLSSCSNPGSSLAC